MKSAKMRSRKVPEVQSEKHQKCDAQNRNEAAKLNLPAS